MTRLTLRLVCVASLMLFASALPELQAQKKAWYEQPQPRFAQSDLGRVFSGTMELRDSRRKTTYKAIAIRVGAVDDPARSGTVVFDTELLRYSGAIPERFVMFNTYREGLGGSGHWVGPPYMFTSRREPGWADNESFADPRAKPQGPLPREHSRYQGLYRHNDRTVLAYTVGETKILDSPWIENFEQGTITTRSLTIPASTTPLVCKICDVDGRRSTAEWQPQTLTAGRKRITIPLDNEQATHLGIVTTAADSKWLSAAQDTQGRVSLQIAARPTTLNVKVLLWTGAGDAAAFTTALQESSAAENLEQYTRPGKQQWQQKITTEVVRGETSGPYAVDTLTVPYENPYRAQMTLAGLDFFKNGDAAVCTIHGDVWRVTGIDSAAGQLEWHRYATGLFQPLGLKIVADQVYVLGRDQITRLHDNNADNEADFYECFNNDCLIGNHVHEYTVCLETAPNGDFFYVKGNNGRQTEHDGSLIRVSKDGQEFEVYATGFRWPNGAGAGPNGTLTVADQQGTWVPSSRLDVIKKGGFYGYVPAHHREKTPETYDGPLCWIPHSVDNSCGGQTWVQGKRWGLPAGMMVHLSYGKCTAFLVLQDQIGDIQQGGVAPLGVNFLSGAMRARFRQQDGQLYACGLRGWQTSAGKIGCFQRVRYTGKSPNLPTKLQVHENGLMIEFSNPVDRQAAGNWENWGIEHWNYRWTSAYGSKDYLVSNPTKTGHDELDVEDVYVSKDGKKVFVEVLDLQPVMQMKIEYNIATTAGDELRNAIYNTIHKLRPEIDPSTIGELVE